MKMTVLVFAMTSKSFSEIGIFDMKTCPEPNIEPWEMPCVHDSKPKSCSSMSHIPFIRPLQPSRRIDQYAMSVRPLRRTDVYPKLLELYTDPNDPCPGIYESQPSSSSDGEVTDNAEKSQPSSSSDGGVADNAETDNDVSTYQNHKHSDVYVETVKDQSASYHGSTESNNLSLKHNTQETSVESGRPLCVYRWSPRDWLMHPSWYCKYTESLYCNYGEGNGLAPDLLELVEQIEYYFSFDNLTNDVNFQEHMNYHGGWVALPFVPSIPEVRELTLNVKVIEEVIKTLSFLIEIKDGSKFIRHRRSWQRWNSFDDELITTSKFARNGN